MSVVTTDQIRVRPWRGYDEPGLPVGMWFGQGSVTGDASAGRATNIFVFKGEAEPVSGRFFNLEQINVIHSSISTRTFSVLANNWEILGVFGLLNRQWRGEIEDNGNSVAAMNEQNHIPLPLFLGAAAPLAGLSAQLEVATTNVDLTSFAVTLQGYIWEGRSVLSEGGLRRPADSLYGGGGGF